MITRRQLISSTTIVVVGLLQTWDSHAFAAGAVIAGMAVAAVVIPALVALLTTRSAIHWMAIATTAVLAFGAKFISPTPLPELGLLILIAAVGLLAPAIIAPRRHAAPQP